VRERQQLADGVRRLMAATVAAAADRLEAVGASGSGPPIARYGEDPRTSDRESPLANWMPFDVIVGRCNPVAPPVTVAFEGDRAIGHVVFTAPYEGAPGCVHGAVIAGTFDIILTAANVLADAAGPTTELTIRYLRPTLVGVPSRFEAWVTAADGRRTSSRGRSSRRARSRWRQRACSPPSPVSASMPCTGAAVAMYPMTQVDRPNRRDRPSRALFMHQTRRKEADDITAG
jgi:hypothetical protein